jgi:hypothetical protein
MFQHHPQKAVRAPWWRSMLFWTVVGSLAGVLTAVLAVAPLFLSSNDSSDDASDATSVGPPTGASTSAPTASGPSAAAASVSSGPSGTAASQPPDSPGRITVVRILPGRGGQIGPMQWRAGSTPGFDIEVYTDAGRVSYSAGCFVAWELKVNGRTTVTSRSRCASGGITPFSSGPLEAGANVVTASVTTEWGASATSDFQFSVVS